MVINWDWITENLRIVFGIVVFVVGIGIALGAGRLQIGQALSRATIVLIGGVVAAAGIGVFVVGDRIWQNVT